MSQRFQDDFKIQEQLWTNRRRFLIGSAVSTGVLFARVPKRVRSHEAQLARIGVMTLSFDHVLKSARHPDDPRRTLDILDLPQMIADRYGVHHVELQHYHFASTESSYPGNGDRLRKAKSHMNQICLEFGALNISSPDPVLRIETVDLTKQWIGHAAAVGCPRVMLNAEHSRLKSVRQPLQV